MRAAGDGIAHHLAIAVVGRDQQGVGPLQFSFQSVPHFHLHLIPRWTDDGKGFDWKVVPGNREVIMKMGERIRSALQ